ncbi:hypothetical protein [Piscinibacter sakaiensis]|uniref:hypothetical protein n=1 Tax=Piscinibacter sakaiensis TaxID=1547922 RepID=UPI003AAFA6A3
MLNTFRSLAAPAALRRLTLLLNHVLASEPAASERLKQHQGRSIVVELERWPSLLPALPPLAFAVTPAGLLEWNEGPAAAAASAEAAADLRVNIDASNPALLLARGLTGERPRIDIAGDAAFATDVNWLFENLRWDVQEDLARLVGDAPARELARFGRMIASALRAAVDRIGRMAPGSSEPPTR